jgi:hypothetical protein
LAALEEEVLHHGAPMTPLLEEFEHEFAPRLEEALRY